MKQIQAVELFTDSANGIYIPQIFAMNSAGIWSGIDKEDRQILADGPDGEWYWEAWETVLNDAYFEHNGDTYTLYQDGDLWAICYERMTDEEKENFGFGE